jgi:hypothetical protein
MTKFKEEAYRKIAYEACQVLNGGHLAYQMVLQKSKISCMRYLMTASFVDHALARILRLVL